MLQYMLLWKSPILNGHAHWVVLIVSPYRPLSESLYRITDQMQVPQSFVVDNEFLVRESASDCFAERTVVSVQLLGLRHCSQTLSIRSLTDVFSANFLKVGIPVVVSSWDHLYLSYRMLELQFLLSQHSTVRFVRNRKRLWDPISWFS